MDRVSPDNDADRKDVGFHLQPGFSGFRHLCRRGFHCGVFVLLQKLEECTGVIGSENLRRDIQDSSMCHNMLNFIQTVSDLRCQQHEGIGVREHFVIKIVITDRIKFVIVFQQPGSFIQLSGKIGSCQSSGAA